MLTFRSDVKTTPGRVIQGFVLGMVVPVALGALVSAVVARDAELLMAAFLVLIQYTAFALIFGCPIWLLLHLKGFRTKLSLALGGLVPTFLVWTVYIGSARHLTYAKGFPFIAIITGLAALSGWITAAIAYREPKDTDAGGNTDAKQRF